MKHILLLLALCLLQQIGTAQFLWTQKLPNASTNANNAGARFENGRYLLASSGYVAEFDQRGTATGLARTWQLPFCYFSQKKSDPLTGKPYLTFCTRQSSNNLQVVGTYAPEDSTVATVTITDSVGPGINGRPAILEIGANSIWLLGRQFVHQVTIGGSGAIILDWGKPLGLPLGEVAVAAVLHHNTVYAVTSKGSVLAFDLNAELLWQKSSNFQFSGIAADGSGLVACGNTDLGKAAIAKFGFNGDLLWAKSYDDKRYNAVVVNTDGSIAVAGTSETDQTVLAKMTPEGAQLWSVVRPEKGQGAALIATPDMGYFFLSLSASNQPSLAIKTDGDGNMAPAMKNLDVSTRTINNGGFSVTQAGSPQMFNNQGSNSLSIPAGSKTSTIYAHSFWMGGLGPQADLHTAVSTYDNGAPRGDFILGPQGCQPRDYKRVWSVTKSDIDALRADFLSDGNLDVQPAYDLLTWPAKGNSKLDQNPDFSQVSSDAAHYIAPFVDFNGDGIYNVYDGDYPVLKGDRMLWWAFNDQTLHTESNGEAFGIDVAVCLYGYDCQGGDLMPTAIFADYTVINRSLQSYTDVYLGFFTDLDIGCSDDDFVGSMPDLNSYFAYNSDESDGYSDGSCSGTGIYPGIPPVQSITFIEKSLDHCISSRQFPPFFVSGGALGHYRLLRSVWPNGVPQTSGGDGYNLGSTDIAPHAYPGNPSDPTSWSQCTTNALLGDRRVIASHGPFNLAAGDTFKLRLAFTFHPNVPHPCPDVDEWVKPRIKQVQQWHNQGMLDAQLDLGGARYLAPGESVALDASLPGAVAYLWSTGATTSGITVTETGVYSVTVTRATGCETSDIVLVKSSTRTDEPVKAARWQLYPNPAREQVNIAVPGAEGRLRAVIFNAQGQAVLEQAGAGPHLAVPAADLPPGLYWVALWREGVFWGGKKVVVR